MHLIPGLRKQRQKYLLNSSLTWFTVRATQRKLSSNKQTRSSGMILLELKDSYLSMSWMDTKMSQVTLRVVLFEEIKVVVGKPGGSPRVDRIC